jgi:hypothetical protein
VTVARPGRRSWLLIAAAAAGATWFLEAQGVVGSPPPSATPPPQPGPPAGPTAPGARTLDGPAVDQPYGAVQVRVTVADGRLTDVRALRYPRDNPTSTAVNDGAVPKLCATALTAPSPGAVDAVSGATLTSGAFRISLQGALDQAGLGARHQ